MTMTNAAETDFLELLFTNLDWPNIGDAAGLQNSATAGTLTIALHTGDPGEAGDQTTNEATYTSYARVTIARSGAGFTVSGNNVSNAAEVAFPQCTGGSDTLTHFSIGTGVSDGMLMSGALTASLAVSSGITPTFAIGDLDCNAD